MPPGSDRVDDDLPRLLEPGGALPPRLVHRLADAHLDLQAGCRPGLGPVVPDRLRGADDHPTTRPPDVPGPPRLARVVLRAGRPVGRPPDRDPPPTRPPLPLLPDDGTRRALAPAAVAAHRPRRGAGVGRAAVARPPGRHAVAGQLAGVVAGVEVDDAPVEPPSSIPCGITVPDPRPATSWSLTAIGPRDSIAAARSKSPINSVVLVSMRITGRPAARSARLGRARLSNGASRSGWRRPIVRFVGAVRLRSRCSRRRGETTWRPTGVANSVTRAASRRGARFVARTSSRLGSPAVWSSSTVRAWAAIAGSVTINRVRRPPACGCARSPTRPRPPTRRGPAGSSWDRIPGRWRWTRSRRGPASRPRGPPTADGRAP